MELSMRDTDIIKKDLNFICDSLQLEFEKISGKNILITGGAGFLGYYLVQSIINWNNNQKPYKKIKLTVIDNFIRGVPQWIKNISISDEFNLVSHDIRKLLPKNLPLFSYIIHAASIASPIYYRKYPIETMDANINGLRHLLDYSQINKKNIEGFLYFSTSEIYGDPDKENIPTTEDYRGNVSCVGPRACYDESKRFGETLCVNFSSQYGIPIGIARPFNNYGPGLKINDGRVISDFAKCVMNNEDIVLYSDGKPTRTFCYIADAIIGYFKILTLSEPGDIFNIGIEKPEISINELANLIVNKSKKLFNYDGTLITKSSLDKDYLTDNPNRRCPSIEKARKQIGFNPTIDITDGIERSLIWYKFNS